MTQDHLDFHGTLENYAAAKALLFQHSENSAINIDDAYGEYMAKAATGSVVTYGAKGFGDVKALNIDMTVEGGRFILQARGAKIPIVVRIPGMFSVYNALAAITISLQLGIDLICIKQGIEVVENVPKLVSTAGYQRRRLCHGAGLCPHARQPENAVRREFARGRVVCVFGCGGNRDNTKRPIMGEIGAMAGGFHHRPITPRFEEPMAIIDEIVPGVQRGGGKHVVIENRREAKIRPGTRQKG